MPFPIRMRRNMMDAIKVIVMPVFRIYLISSKLSMQLQILFHIIELSILPECRPALSEKDYIAEKQFDDGDIKLANKLWNVPL